MGGTIHGNVDCLVGSAEPARTAAHTLFTSTFKLLTSLTSSGRVSRIAYNTGSFGTGTGYWDEADNFGRNAWALFRFNTSPARTWEWYFLIQVTSGTGNFGAAPGNPGLLNGVAEAQSGNEGSFGMASATMLGTGGLNLNPWNGTTLNDGNDVKGDPVWSGSLADESGDRLAILPRSNNEGGSHTTSRENMAKAYNSGTATVKHRFHILIDDDSIAFFSSEQDSGAYSCNYVGMYEPRTEISGTLFTPMVMFVSNLSLVNLLAAGESYGSTAGNNTGYEGGIVVSGAVRIGRISKTGTSWQEDPELQPNTAIWPPQHDIFSIPVLAFESPDIGHVGYIDTPIYQEIYNAENHATNISVDRTVFGNSTAANTIKIITAWNSSVGAPGTSATRTGSLF